MTADTLEVLFDRYRRDGDLAALARVVETVAPELLRLARYLRPRGQTPEDLVQATFLAALTSRERYDAQRPLRPWLFGILLNKAAGGRRAELELAAEVPDKGAAEKEAESAEAARLLAQGLDRLPPIYSEVLREHFFAGMSPGEIADRHGRPPGTVRAQLHRGLRLLRTLVPASLASRLLWFGPARPSLLRVRRNVLERASHDSSPVGTLPGPPPIVGVRIVGAFAIAVVVGLGLREWTKESQLPLSPEEAHSAPRSDLASELPNSRVSGTRTLGAAPASEASQLGEAAATGELIVRVLFPDGTAAPGIGLRIYAWAEPSWQNNQTRGVTDASGDFVLARIPPGKVGIYCDRGGGEGFGATVSAGERTLRELTLPRGVDVVGEVVDARGTPVARAGIWLSESPLPNVGRVTVECDELGRFRLRDVSPRRFIGALADGFAPSDIEWLASGGLRAGASTNIRLTLVDSGGAIAGSVLDPFGAPVEGAEVVVRSKLSRGVRLRKDGVLLGPSAPFEAKTSANGRFEFADLSLEEYEVLVRASGRPARSSSVQLSPSTRFEDLEVRLAEGGKLSGTVKFPDGKPARGAVIIVQSGDHNFMDHEVDEDGAFALEGLAPGTLELQAGYGHSGGGQVTRTTLQLGEAGELRWDAIIQPAKDVSGRIVGPRGEPIVGAWLQAVSTEHESAVVRLPSSRDDLAAWLNGWNDRYLKSYLNQIASDSEGRFTLRGVPRPFAIEVRLPDERVGWPVRVFDPAPEDGELELSTNDRNTARFSGIIESADESGSATGVVYAVRRSGGSRRVLLDETGGFQFETLPPGEFEVLLWARGHLPRIMGEVTLVEGEARELGRLRLP